MSVEDLSKIAAHDFLPNEQIEKIYCDKCGKMQKWTSYCGHYNCAACGDLVGFWMGSGNGMPLSWNEDGSGVHLVKCKIKKWKKIEVPDEEKV